MKKILFSIFIILTSTICYSQSNNIVGAWLWRDSTTSFSLLINKDGTIEKFSRPINDPAPSKNRKKGTYKFIDTKKLIIIWADKSTETDKVKFIDNSTLEIEMKSLKSDAHKTYIFVKVVDEEVELPPRN
jgi:hypothetical protein